MLMLDRNAVQRRRKQPADSGCRFGTDRAVLLLAGGDGMRLRELTSAIAGEPVPKQYCRLWKGTSLLEASIARARLFAPTERINVVVNRDHLHLARGQVGSLPRENVIVQPLNRDTGPGVLFALFHLQRRNPHATVAVFPTDHYIDQDRAFIEHVIRAAGMVLRYPDRIAILGIAPDRPETGYGYIVPERRLRPYANAYGVAAFTEKPDCAVAEEIIRRGGLWNTFVMVFKVSRMIEMIRRLVPEALERMSGLYDNPERADEVYRTLPSWNLSTDVLAHIPEQLPERLVVVKVANVRWSDWGTRESVERTYRALHLAPIWKTATPRGKASPGQEQIGAA